MTEQRTRTGAAAPLVLALALAACADSPPPAVYTLASLPATSTPAQAKHAVAVRAVSLPRYLDRPQMVRYSTGYRLDIAEFERWGEPLGAMVTRVLIADLGRRLPNAQVFLDTGVAGVPPDLGLEVAISRFEPDADDTVILDGRWTLRRTADDTVVATRTATISVPPAAPTTEARVAAMSTALARLADDIVASLPRGR